MAQTKYQLTNPLIMWLIVVVGGIALWLSIPAGGFVVSDSLGLVILIVGIVNWFYVTTAAMKVHRKALSSVQNIDQLVTEGVYAVVRHPMYLADIILAFSIFIWLPTYKILAVALWLSLVLMFWANLEERLLEEKFLDDYRKYKQNVSMFWPRFSKPRN